MKEFLNLTRGALLLETNTFLDLRGSPDVFRKGFTVVLVIGLIVGLVTGLVGIARGLSSDPAAAIGQARAEAVRSMQAFIPPASLDAETTQYFNIGWNIAERIVRQARAPLPRPIDVVFNQLGVVVSFPFGWLGSLLFYGVLVQISAKLVGGRGSIAQMLGLSSLTVAPHLLDLLSPILGLASTVGSCLAALIGLVAFVWGVVIYGKGTAIAHELTAGKAVFAMLLPVLVLVLLAMFAMVPLALLIATSAGGN